MMVAELFAALSLKPDMASWANGSKLIDGIRKGLVAMVSVEAVKGLFELFSGVEEAAIGFGRLAQKLGVSTASIQELGYAASASGASAEDLQTSWQHLAKGLDEGLTKGTGPAVDGLRALGISMSDPIVKSGDLGAITAELADKFKAMPDSAHKTALSMDLFGRSGTALIPMLNRGAKGIADLRAEFVDTGAEIDDGAIKSFEDLEGTQKQLGATWTGIKNQLVIGLLPAIKDIAESLLGWIKANRELITTTVKGVVEGIITAFKVLAWVVHALIVVVGWLARVFGLLWAGLKAGANKVAAAWRWLSDKFWEVVDAVKAGLDKIRQFFSDVADGIKKAWSDMLDWIEKTSRDILKNPVIRAVMTIMGQSSLLDQADKLMAAQPSREDQHKAYAQRPDKDKAMSEDDWINKQLEYGNHSLEDMTAPPTLMDKAFDWAETGEGSGDVTAPMRGFPAGGSMPAPAPQTNNVNTTFNVSSPNADPTAVANIVNDKISEHWDLQMRTTDAATGGADAR